MTAPLSSCPTVERYSSCHGVALSGTCWQACLLASRNLLVADQHVTAAGREVDADPVAGPQPRESATRGAFRRTIENRRAVRGARLPAIAERRQAHDAALQQRIGRLHVHDLRRARPQTTSHFKDKSIVRCERSKSAIISGRSSFKIQRNLGDSLNLLWNNLHAVSQNGTVILLSENKEGIGNDALAKYIEGRLDLSGLNKFNYVNEMEHLNFLQILKDKYEIILVSTIPQVYLNKLGLKPIQKIQDGLGHVLKNYGKNLKINIIPNSEVTLVTNDS